MDEPRTTSSQPVLMLRQPPAGLPPSLQPGPDDRRLRWLSRGQHVFARIILVLGVVCLLPLGGFFMEALRDSGNWVAAALWCFVFLVIEGLAMLVYLCARRLAAGERLQFCQTTAFMECGFVPLGAVTAFIALGRLSPLLAWVVIGFMLFGAVLGMLTYSALRKPRVQARFRS